MPLFIELCVHPFLRIYLPYFIVSVLKLRVMPFLSGLCAMSSLQTAYYHSLVELRIIFADFYHVRYRGKETGQEIPLSPK